MSANTSIKEGGKGRSFGPVTCLMVQGDNGTYYPWYPESDRQLDSLSVDKNGIYQASKYGVYGWDRVSVNVAQSDRVTGKDPETGEEKTVTVDPETGELVETVVPVEIRITTLPTKTEYANGETIDYSGIVVHAYSSTGQDMGEVPFSALVFPVTTAQGGNEWSDGQGLNAMMLYYTPKPWIDWAGRESVKYVAQVLGTYNNEEASYGSEGDPATALITRYANNNYGVLVNGTSAGGGLYAKKEKSETSLEQGWRGVGSAGGLSSKTEFTGMAWSEFLTSVPVSSVDPTTVDPSNLHATQSLPVQWQDPDSGAVLETSFNITVTGGE